MRRLSELCSALYNHGMPRKPKALSTASYKEDKSTDATPTVTQEPNRAFTPRPSGYIQSVDRALSILEIFSSRKPEIGVSEIARLLNLNKSTVFGLISTLERRGYIEQNPDNGLYRLGLKTIELSQNKLSAFSTAEIAHPILRKLVDTVKETVHLAIYDRGEVVYIDKVECDNALSIASFIGKRNPAYCTGVGKCLFAFQTDEEIERVLRRPLEKRTPKTITEIKRLKDELATIRKSKIAYDDEEFSIGLKCFAAPVIDARGAVCAAVSISIPTIRLDVERESFLETSVRGAAKAISEALGYQNQ